MYREAVGSLSSIPCLKGVQKSLFETSDVQSSLETSGSDFDEAKSQIYIKL